MGMPRAVKEAGERSEQALAELKKRQEQGQQDPPAEQQDPPPNDQGQPPQDPPAGNQPAPQGEGQPAKDEFRDKFFVLKGKYDAEVPRMAAEIRALRARNQALEDAIVELKKVKAPETPPAPPTPHPDEQALVQEYGPKIVETIERIADRKAAERMAPLQGKIEETEAEAEARRQQEIQDRKAQDFKEAVEDLVPDWEAIDKMPAFHAYLAERHTDGRERQAALMEAAGRFDAATVVRIFAAFKRTPEGQKAIGAKPQGSKTAGLEHLRVPDATGRDRGNAGGKKIWTKKEMTDFYRDNALGRIDPERAKEIERDIDAAAGEGRIRG
jgi:hypothetical protein